MQVLLVLYTGMLDMVLIHLQNTHVSYQAMTCLQSAEKGLALFCKPVTLYHIIQERAKQNVIFILKLELYLLT
jgi:hypothetical protein